MTLEELSDEFSVQPRGACVRSKVRAFEKVQEAVKAGAAALANWRLAREIATAVGFPGGRFRIRQPLSSSSSATMRARPRSAMPRPTNVSWVERT